MTEGRNFERLHFPIEIEYVVSGKDRLAGKAAIKNISLGGLQLHVRERVEEGEKIVLHIRMDSRKRPTTIQGEIVWSKENHDRGKGFFIGVRFTQADPYDVEELLAGLSNRSS